MRLLVIEDDPRMAKLLRVVMADEGYAVDVAHDGEEGRMLALVNDYDGVLLDLDLGGRDGIEILLELRRAGKTTPVLVLTGREDRESVIRSLDAGADEYAMKPISNDELRARARALVRRGGSARVSEQLAVGNITLNRMTRKVRIGSTELLVTPRELALLEHLMLRADSVVSRTELLEKVWDTNFDPDSNVIDAHITRLRRKLRTAGATATVVTRRGFGFVMTAAHAE